MVDAFNGMLPRNAPRLRYEPMPHVRCEALLQPELARRGITVCNAAHLVDPVVAQVDNDVTGDGYFRRALVRLSVDRPPEQTPLCHELMHALTDVPDPPVRTDRPYPELSCVWGILKRPGPLDRDLIHRLYGHEQITLVASQERSA